MADQDLGAQWEEYKKKFRKVYDPEEDVMRRGLWEASLKKVELHNKLADEGKHSWWMGINQFSDLKSEELSCCGCQIRKCPSETKEKVNPEEN